MKRCTVDLNIRLKCTYQRSHFLKLQFRFYCSCTFATEFSTLEHDRTRYLLSQFITPIRDCSVNTELISRVDCAKQKLCVERIRTEVNRTSPTFLFQESPIQRTGSSEKWMSAVLAIGNHDICTRITRSFRFVTVRSVPCFFFTKTDKRPTSQQKSRTFSAFEKHSW